jgi:hypothetical protein
MYSDITELISLYSSGSHGISKEKIFVANPSKNEFAPLGLILKKIDGLHEVEDLVRIGYSYLSIEIDDYPAFNEWFFKQFSLKLTGKLKKDLYVLYPSDDQIVLNTLSKMDFLYQILHKEKVLLNNKHLTTQLGEWYARAIFGIIPKKSISVRGFDFFLENIPVEIKVAWPEKTSPKGIRILKSSMENSTFLIIIYLTRNFLIRDILFLDSKQYLFNLDVRGETIFVKESSIKKFLFSKSDYFFDRVVNSNALLKFATPTLAIKLGNLFLGPEKAS